MRRFPAGKRLFSLDFPAGKRGQRGMEAMRILCHNPYTPWVVSKGFVDDPVLGCVAKQIGGGVIDDVDISVIALGLHGGFVQ